jgi:nucleoporin GLE1
LQLEQNRETQQLVSAFERRNKSLWDSIESSIKLAEEEQRHLEEKRRKEEEQERKAKEMRDAEIKRQEEERRKVEQREKEEQVEREKERERVEREKQEREQKEAELEKKNSAIVGKRTGEGSPKGEFEKWTSKMNVSLLSSCENGLYNAC